MHDQFSNRRFGTRQLALESGGIPLVGGGQAAYAIQAAATTLPPQLKTCLDRLRGMQPGEVVVLSTKFDEVSLLLDALGVTSTSIAPEDLPLTEAKVAIAGCPHRFFRLDPDDVEPFLGRGGVLVSSDRAADLPGIGRYVPVLTGRPPKLVRVAYEGANDLAGLYPLVKLDPGHRAIDGQYLAERHAQTLAIDLHTGEPLVALVGAGNGAILHAVPHWLQAGPLETRTAVEQRPLRDVPTLASVGNSFPRLSLGRYLSQRAMLELLLSGIAAATGAGQNERAPRRRRRQHEG